MKNTVFTVMTVVLLLTTVQFASGEDRTFTIRNQSDEDAWVSYGVLLFDGDEDQASTIVVKGHYKVKSSSGTLRLNIPQGYGFLRIQQNGQTILPGDTETNAPFFLGIEELWTDSRADHTIYQVDGSPRLETVLDGTSYWGLGGDPLKEGIPPDWLPFQSFWSWNNAIQTHHPLVYNIGGTNRASDAVTIDGLHIPYGQSLPNKGGNAFITLEQMGRTCGPTSLEMVLHYYGKWVHQADIWRAGDINTVLIGTFPGEMKQALNGLGVPAAWYDWGDDPFGRLRTYVDQSRPPCILLRYKAVKYHWVVVVGYNTPTDEYLIADPAYTDGAFRWISGEQLDAAWGFKTDVDATLWYGGFNVLGEGWLDLGVSFKAQPYTRIVPRSAPTSHFNGMWSEMKSFRMTGTGRVFGTRRGWDKTIEFDHKFKYHKAASIAEITSLGTGELHGSEKVGTKSVKLWGRIEDGLTFRGRMQVIVRTYRTEESPAAPSQVVSTRLSALSAETSLLPNYPNPFNPETWIPYQLAEPAEVTVTIHSSDGKLVRTLELGQMPAGAYSDKDRAAYWDGQNEQGEPVASGVYFYTLTAGDFSATRKMVIRK